MDKYWKHITKCLLYQTDQFVLGQIFGLHMQLFKDVFLCILPFKYEEENSVLEEKNKNYKTWYQRLREYSKK